MSERPVPNTNLSHLPAEMIVAILKRLPTQYVWTEVSQTWKWMRDLVRDHHFSQQQSLTLVVNYRTPIIDAERLVADAETAIQLEDYFVDARRLRTVPRPLASIRTPDRLTLPWFTRDNVARLIESFTNLRTLQIVINSQADFTQERFLVELLRAWTSKLTSLKLWIRTLRVLDGDGQAVSRLTRVWPVVGLMRQLKQLTLEVQQNGGLNPATRLALDQHVPDFQVELTNLVQLERFSFGSADRSTTVWNSLLLAQENINLQVIEYGGPLILNTQIAEIPGPGPNMLDRPDLLRPVFARERIHQIGVHITHVDQLRTFCQGLPQLRKLFVSAPELHESALVETIAQAKLAHLTDLRLYFRADRSSHNPFCRFTVVFFVDVVLPTVQSLTIGLFPYVHPHQQIDLIDLNFIFPNVQGLTLCFDDRAIRHRAANPWAYHRRTLFVSRATMSSQLRVFRMEFLVGGSFQYQAREMSILLEREIMGN